MTFDHLTTLAFVSAMALGGVAALGAAATGWRNRVDRASAVAGWQRVSGRIVEADVLAHWTSDGNQYEPRVRFTYDVAGGTLYGDRLRVGGGAIRSASRGVAEAAIAPYRVGAEVRPYVDPSDPQRAVLEARASTSGLGLLVAVGVALLGTAVFMAVALS